MTNIPSALLTQFESLTVNAAEFGHRQHIEVAFEMLNKYNFLEACTRYAHAINRIAIKAGAPEKFNVTITLAFLSLIAERMHGSTSWSDSADFLEHNEDLLSKQALARWYSSEQLQSDFARTHFMLPRNAA